MSKIETRSDFMTKNPKSCWYREGKKEPKSIKIYLNNRTLEQVPTIKYLGIIIDKLKFKEQMRHVAERCMKLIRNLSRSAKLTWGLIHEATKVPSFPS
jgi:hypothetical protein